MTPSAFRAARLSSQLISQPRLKTAAEVVGWLGGMQGQDYAAVKWSIGLRLPGATEEDVERAIQSRTILRTWPMRGTLHMVAAADVWWLLALTAPKNIAGMARRHRDLELDDALLGRCRDRLARMLEGGKQLGRDEIYALLERDGITTPGQRGYHMLWDAAQHGLICCAGQQGKTQTFASLDDWAPPSQAAKLSRDEGLAELARRYIRSRGPVTQADYLWWSGLSAAEARAGFEAVKPEFERVTLDGQDYWLSAEAASCRAKPSAFALPGFDEYLLGYKDREMVLPPEHADKVCPGGNGVFAATMVLDGRVVGTWRRAIKRKSVDLSLAPFDPMTDADRSRFIAAAERYAAYMRLPARFDGE